MSKVRLALILALASLASLACAVATAQEEAPARLVEAGPLEDPPGYRELITAAISEYEAGRLDEARLLMQRAHSVFPNARTLRGLGMVAFELREYAESARRLDQALRSPLRPLEGELRTQTVALLARAHSFVGRLTLDLKPASITVFVDGVAVDVDGTQPLTLALGDHTIEVRAVGYVTELRRFHVVGGEEASLRFALTPLAVPAAQREARPLRRNPWLWISVGVVVAAGAATAIVLSRDEPAKESPYRGLSDEPPLMGPSK